MAALHSARDRGAVRRAMLKSWSLTGSLYPTLGEEERLYNEIMSDLVDEFGPVREWATGTTLTEEAHVGIVRPALEVNEERLTFW